MFVDKTAALPVEEVLQKPFFPLSKSVYTKPLPPGKVQSSYFLKFHIYNDADTIQSFFLFPGSRFEKIEIYKIKGNVVLQSSLNDPRGFQKMLLAPKQRTTFLTYLKPIKNENVIINPELVRAEFLDNFRLMMLYKRSEITRFGYVMSGVLVMMILFMLTNFVISKKNEFLYNAMYSLCMFLLIYFNSFALRSTSEFSNFFISYLDFFLLVTGTIFYIAFTRSFLNTSTKYLYIDKLLKYSQVFLFIVLISYTALNFFTNLFPLQNLLENTMKFLSLGLGLYFIVLAVKQKNRLLNYIAAGNAALVFFSAISLGLIIAEVKFVEIYYSSLFYYYLGIAFELIFFLLGLTYKNRMELIAKTREQAVLKIQSEKQEYETQITIMKAQQEERNRISADMHDDLGAGMTTIRLYSELARNKMGENAIPELEKISSSADELLNKMNAIIWSMTSSNDTFGNMVAYIRSYALEYFENTGVNCRFNIADNLPDIEVIGEIRRNIFLVIKEALNNILKHAKATEVTITLKREQDVLTLYIQDNGVGINPEKLRQFGNGLKNMKKRMAAIEIDFHIENNNGTLITLQRKVKSY